MSCRLTWPMHGPPSEVTEGCCHQLNYLCTSLPCIWIQAPLALPPPVIQSTCWQWELSCTDPAPPEDLPVHGNSSSSASFSGLLCIATVAQSTCCVYSGWLDPIQLPRKTLPWEQTWKSMFQKDLLWLEKSQRAGVAKSLGQHSEKSMQQKSPFPLWLG